VKDSHLQFIFAFPWILLVAIYFYRTYAGTIPGSMRTLNHSPEMMRKKSRWVNAALGILYLGIDVAYLALKHRRHI
jgi:hypothetical protein